MIQGGVTEWVHVVVDMSYHRGLASTGSKKCSTVTAHPAIENANRISSRKRRPKNIPSIGYKEIP